MLAYFTHFTINYITSDKVMADYGVPMLYNIGYLITAVSSILYNYSIQQRLTIIKHVISALVGYYSMDIVNLYFDQNAKYRLAYIVHHIASIQLLYLHYIGVLPLSVGIIYLTLFEVSNLFLLPYQLCLYKGWNTMKYKLAHPMVYTYVPIRLVAIPLCSVMYWFAFDKYNKHYSSFVHDEVTYIYCKTLLTLLNIFSMYYGVAIGYKYYLYLTKK
jgi:hypothetical protein